MTRAKIRRASQRLFYILERRKDQKRLRNYITSHCLRNVEESDWMVIYRSGTDENFMALTSLNRLSFEKLLTGFSKEYHINSSVRGGRPSKLLKHHQVLGCILMFYCDTIGYKNLSVIFAIPPSTLSRVLNKAELALRRALREFTEAEIRWPTLEEQRDWASKVNRKNELVQGRWGFIDGKNFKVQTPSDAEKQNALYNGWLHCVFVTGSICFGVDGCIAWFRHNCPGSWNDGETSRKFQIKLARDDINLEGHGVLSDSAFPVSGEMFGKIVTPLKENDLERAHPQARPMLARLSAAITSMRQSAEWGMGAPEKVYRRLLERMPYDQKKRALRIDTLFHLYNFRVRTTGVSQIRTYFNSDEA